MLSLPVFVVEKHCTILSVQSLKEMIEEIMNITCTHGHLNLQHLATRLAQWKSNVTFKLGQIFYSLSLSLIHFHTHEHLSKEITVLRMCISISWFNKLLYYWQMQHQALQSCNLTSVKIKQRILPYILSHFLFCLNINMRKN